MLVLGDIDWGEASYFTVLENVVELIRVDIHATMNLQLLNFVVDTFVGCLISGGTATDGMLSWCPPDVTFL